MAKVEGASVRLIKRYANRKLYDTRESRYVTLQQIANYVRNGEDVAVIDNKSKEDLTNVTLAQIIYEEEKKGDKAGRSVKNLRSFIQDGIHESTERIITTFREMPIGKLVLREEGEDGEGAVSSAEDGKASDGSQAPEAEPSRKLMLSPKEAFEELQRLADERIKSLIEQATGHINQLNTEVKRLQTRIEDLEARLVSLGRRGGAASDEVEDASPARERSASDEG